MPSLLNRRHCILVFALINSGALVGCSSVQSWVASPVSKRPLRRPPPKDFPPHQIRFSDSDGFDMMLETALMRKQPSIVIETDAKTPDEIDDRVQAWVSAWMDGGELDVPNSKGLGATQAILLGLEVANSAEFNEFMDHAQQRAAKVAAWYNDRKTKEKRVALLKPYVLAFESRQQDGPIRIRLYNGLYEPFMNLDSGVETDDSDAQGAPGIGPKIGTVSHQETPPPAQ
ncbi:MAG: hypothetical protein AAGC97_18515 [Planctomycetota bacterium]